MQTLCIKCHSAKTLQENIERGKGWFAYSWGKKK
jgi:5-methylcytosine-specific restriction endonuclease McrA